MVNQKNAKQFFVSRIVQIASQNNILLSKPEKYMLKWSESDENFEINRDLVDQFENTTSDELFEKKIVGLIKDAYHRDRMENPNAKKTWREMYNSLKKGDHYILVMLQEAIGNKLNKWFFF